MRAINTFWNWFQDNNQTIKNLINETPENQKHISFWINKNLSYYCKEIDFMIVFPKKNTDKTELIITANGNPEYFNQVINLVDNAPQLKTWKFTAFIQPTERIDEIMNGLDEPYIFHEITLKASELTFLPLEYHEITHKFDIVVFLKNYNLYCDTKTFTTSNFHHHARHCRRKIPLSKHQFCTFGTSTGQQGGIDSFVRFSIVSRQSKRCGIK